MTNEQLAEARILIIDDQEPNLRVLDRLLRRAGYGCLRATTDPREGVASAAAFRPDLVLLDLHMPELDGFGVLDALRASHPADEYLPVLILTGDETREVKQRALAAGAKDFLTKPFQPTETLLRIRNLLETRLLHMELRRQNERLEARVRERTQELEGARLEILDRLARAAEYRDDTTGEHTRRVGETAALLAEQLGLSAEEVELIRRAAPLHDIGKIGIPDRILLKAGRLTPEEFEVMKTHTEIGAQILSGSRIPVLVRARQIALTHHAHWDGGGYPELAGVDIPVSGRIVALADVFDALTHERPYKPPWPPAEAFEEIEGQSGSHFDPSVVDAFAVVYEAGVVPL